MHVLYYTSESHAFSFSRVQKFKSCSHATADALWSPAGVKRATVDAEPDTRQHFLAVFRGSDRSVLAGRAWEVFDIIIGIEPMVTPDKIPSVYGEVLSELEHRLGDDKPRRPAQVQVRQPRQAPEKIGQLYGETAHVRHMYFPQVGQRSHPRRQGGEGVHAHFKHTEVGESGERLR